MKIGTKVYGVAVLAVVAYVHHGSALAADPLDAGALQGQIEQGLKATPLQRWQAVPKVSRDVAPAREGAPVVQVNRFVFEGHTLLSAEQLTAIVAPYQGHSYDLDQLRHIAAIVADAYREAGWLVRVFVPQQDVQDGAVRLQIVEARFGKVLLQGTQQRVAPQWLLDTVTAAQAADQAISPQKIDRTLLLLDDVPGLSVSGNLLEGQAGGQTDLLLHANDRASVEGNITADNAGARSTGAWRAMGSLNVNSPLQLGDQLALVGLKTEGSHYLRLGYTLPVGYDGLRVGANASHMGYGLIGDMASLGSKGSADARGLELSYPWLRSQQTNLRLNAIYADKRFDNNANGVSVSSYGIGVLTLGFQGTHIDDWLGGGTSSAGLSLSSGSVNLDGSANQSTDASGAATAGRFSKLNLSANRLHNLSASLSALVSLNVQRASKNLDSSERLYLGGANGVRAYPTSEGGGSEGEVLTAELRQQLDSVTSLTGFYDLGHVQAYKNNVWADGSGRLNSGSMPNRYTLKGYGLSLAWNPKPSTVLRATLARRIGTSPIANTSTGTDGDGTLQQNRLWLNASYSF